MKQTLALLWLLVLLGVLAHSVLGFVPMLYGGEPLKQSENLQGLLWQLTLVFATYLALALIVLLSEVRWLKWLNLTASGFFLISNTLHAGVHLFLSPIEWHQVMLLALVAGINAVHFKNSLTYLKST
ncbi:MAG: hypothetical protein ACK4XY_02365 [Chloroherpetonaceae bacterium]